MSSTVAPPAFTITAVSSAADKAPMSANTTPAQTQQQKEQETLPSGPNISNVVRVKRERHDEAEIQELANKFRETQKAAMAKQTQQQQMPISTVINGQSNILTYLTRKSPTTVVGGAIPVDSRVAVVATSTIATTATVSGTTTAKNDENGSDEKPFDEESCKGHFGWDTIEKTYIPYIVRQPEKYCAVRMLEMKLLNKYLRYLHPDIYSTCTCVRSYYITEAECRLLNEINHIHCDGQFGREMSSLRDLVVRLSDAKEFYQFLDICYRKLLNGNKSTSNKCGFIQINKESVVPYAVRQTEQVVPLFYFEGETENLRQKADSLSGWDLAYLKFCCKVQGIRNELFSSESVAVITLNDIKSYFPNGTEFEEYWPSKMVDSNLTLAARSDNNSVHWTRQPSEPPPKILDTGLTVPKQLQQQSILKTTYFGNPGPTQNPNATQRMYPGSVASMISSQIGITAAAEPTWPSDYVMGTAIRVGQNNPQNNVRMAAQIPPVSSSAHCNETRPPSAKRSAIDKDVLIKRYEAFFEVSKSPRDAVSNVSNIYKMSKQEVQYILDQHYYNI